MFATIYLPNFYLQAAMRHQPELRAKPVALMEEQEKKPLIVQLNEAAKRAGICRGMTPSQALARSLQVVIKVRAHAQEKSIQEILLHHAFTLSPFVENTAPGVCTVQFADNRYLSEKVSRVIEQLGACQIHAQAGIACVPEVSFLAAHVARPVLQVERPRNFLRRCLLKHSPSAFLLRFPHRFSLLCDEGPDAAVFFSGAVHEILRPVLEQNDKTKRQNNKQGQPEKPAHQRHVASVAAVAAAINSPCTTS